MVQIHLCSVLLNPTLLVFWMDITRDVYVHYKAIDPVHLSIINGQMKYPDGGKRGEASGGFCQAGTVLLAGLVSFYSHWTWLDVPCSSGLGVTSSGRLLVRIQFCTPVLDMVSTAGRTTGEAFSESKPTSYSCSGLKMSEGDASRRVVDTHLACIHFSFLATSNASDVLRKSYSS